MTIKSEKNYCIIPTASDYNEQRNNYFLLSYLDRITDNVWNEFGSSIHGENSGDQLGYSVSINDDGDVVVIGGIYNNGNGSSSGHVRVYQWDGEDWKQLGKDIDGEASGDRSGYSVSINSQGDRIAIGAINNDGNGNNSGHVRVYQWDGNQWIKVGQDIDGEASGDRSGYSISINSQGNRIAIGAINNNGSGPNSGHVRVYEWNGSQWFKLGQDIDGEFSLDLSGYSVSINAIGDIVAIGAIYNDGNGNNSGHVRVYSWNEDENQWVQLGQDIDGENSEDQLGYSVSINNYGDKLIIGAYLNSNNKNNSGQAKVYELHGNEWKQLGQTIYGQSANELLGYSVSINGDGSIIAISSIYGNKNDFLNKNTGQVKIYKWDGALWKQLGQNINGENNEDRFGFQISINSLGNAIVISSPYNDNNNKTNNGSVKIYKIDDILDSTKSITFNFNYSGSKEKATLHVYGYNNARMEGFPIADFVITSFNLKNANYDYKGKEKINLSFREPFSGNTWWFAWADTNEENKIPVGLPFSMVPKECYPSGTITDFGFVNFNNHLGYSGNKNDGLFKSLSDAAGMPSGQWGRTGIYLSSTGNYNIYIDLEEHAKGFPQFGWSIENNNNINEYIVRGSASYINSTYPGYGLFAMKIKRPFFCKQDLLYPPTGNNELIIENFSNLNANRVRFVSGSGLPYYNFQNGVISNHDFQIIKISNEQKNLPLRNFAKTGYVNGRWQYSVDSSIKLLKETINGTYSLYI
jgi:hypothetical protein